MSQSDHLTDNDLVLMYIRYITGKAYVSHMARENNISPAHLSKVFTGYIRRDVRRKADKIIADRHIDYQPHWWKHVKR